MAEENFGFQWHITNHCNNNCKHCYQNNSLKQIDELSIEQMKIIADNILNSIPNHNIEINITGGEPFIYPHIIELLQYLDHFKNISTINIITNALKIDENTLLECTKLNKVKSIKVSLESHNQNVNDEIRGSGSFVTTLNNIRKIQNSTRFNVILMVTLSKANYQQIPQIIEFAIQNKLDGIIFERFIPLGRSKKNNFLTMTLSKFEWLKTLILFFKFTNILPQNLCNAQIIQNILHNRAIISELAQIKAFSVTLHNKILRNKSHKNNDKEKNNSKLISDIISTDELYSNSRILSKLDHNMSENLIEIDENNVEVAYCNLGENSMAVMPNGTVYPCRRLEINIGNLLSESFTAIRKKLRNWNYENIRYKLEGANCKNCNLDKCFGCRALSNAIYLNPYKDDPMCFLNNNKK